ncbi:MAG: hypothetical protein COV36_02350 [Alphaproteobacteria bacterium CG11_big_fil_rev_8_21_14_0_20_44_7]|nr:MAG: hypothetical protein COV36_02350 [Alphaproteobacteria bacterium CG11_big_fil_rev_8_21_14_0_20_44_7]
MNISKLFALSLISVFSLSGCAAGVLVTTAEAAKTIAQERSAGNRVDDNGIAIQINNAFIQKDVDDLFAGINTKISEGRVLLTGTVRDPQHRVEAEKMVWKIAGVNEVMNEIQVVDSEKFSSYAHDVWISNYLRGKLLFAKGIAASNYNVETVNGTVYLMGIAQDELELRKAIEIARRIEGVNQVVSHVIKKDDPRRSNLAAANRN